MIIDWFTIIAQAINFIILIWLMKRFLYKPIHTAIDEREKKIAAKIADAEKKKLEAQNESDDFKKKNKDLDEQRDRLLKKATDDAQKERERLLDEARKSVTDLKSKRQQSFKDEEKVLFENISLRVQQEVFSISRKALSDIAGVDLQEQVVHQFIIRIKNLSSQEKENLSSSFQKSSDELIVNTSFSLSEKLRADVDREIKTLIKSESSDAAIRRIKFKISPDLICGIEFGTTGKIVRWSLADYLGSLEKDVQELLNKKGPDKIQNKPPVVDTRADVKPSVTASAQL